LNIEVGSANQSEKGKGLWKRYKETVNRNCSVSSGDPNGLPYWRNKLFAAVMLYLLPIGLVAIIPGIIMSVISDAMPLAIFDAFIGIFISFISLIPGLSVNFRKSLFIVTLYLTAIILLYYLGSFGPGLLYLLAVTIFVVLIFPKRAGFISVFINLIICTAFGIAIYFKLINSPLIPHYSVGSWIAVSSNVIVLSSVMVVLLPMLFNGLQKIIEDQIRLRNQLKKEQQSLEKTLEMVKHKNSELEQFAYIASHDLQEPLRSISGLITMMQKRHNDEPEDKQIMHHIVSASDRMRSLVTGCWNMRE
jgi:signal transduction histidine kinase